MLKNYLKIALRNIKDQKGYSFINIVSLAIGLTCCMLILLYIQLPFYSETLRSLMRKGIPSDKVLSNFSQILDGVEAAHLQGIWHRDLNL